MCCIHTVKDIVKLLSQSDNPIILVFDSQRRYTIPKGTRLAGAQKHAGGKFLRLSTEIAVYVGNGTYEICNVNRKSWVADRSVSVPMKLSDL